MENIRPVSDLRNHFSEISRMVHENNTPVILTKNGYGDMVVLSMDNYRKFQYDTEIYMALKAAETEAANPNTKWFSHTEVMAELLELLPEEDRFEL